MAYRIGFAVALYCILTIKAFSGPLETWTESPVPEGAAPASIAFGNDIFVAVGSSIITSTNGIDWTRQNSVTNTVSRVKFVNGTFFAFGSATVLLSTNGVEWVPLGPIESLPHPLQDITFGNGHYYGVTQTPGDYRELFGWSAISTNLQDWEVRENNALRNGSRITYGKGLFVAHTAYVVPGIFETFTVFSTNGMEWQSGTPTYYEPRDSYMGETYYQNDLFFVVHKGAALFGGPPDTAYILSYSIDGITFTNALRLQVRNSGLGLKSASGGDFYVYPAGNSIYYTTNLIPATESPNPSTNWTRVPLDVASATHADIAFGNGTFVVLTSGRVFKSNPISGSAPARIMKQPDSVSLTVGATATFSVIAHGSDPISYQWRKDGTDISGATNSTLNIPSVTVTSAGDYDVRVTNPNGTVLSAKASLRVSFAEIKRYSGVTLRGNVGEKFLIEYQDELDETGIWTTVTNITLTAPESIWIDLTSAEKSNRFYRAVYQGQ